MKTISTLSELRFLVQAWVFWGLKAEEFVSENLVFFVHRGFLKTKKWLIHFGIHEKDYSSSFFPAVYFFWLMGTAPSTDRAKYISKLKFISSSKNSLRPKKDESYWCCKNSVYHAFIAGNAGSFVQNQNHFEYLKLDPSFTRMKIHRYPAFEQVTLYSAQVA